MATSNDTTKVCTKCGNEYPATPEHFYANRQFLTPLCKACYREREQQRRKAKASEISEQRKAKYRADPEPAKARAHEWRANNPERKKQLDREYAASHPESMAEKKRRWVEAHPDRRLEVSRAYRKRNPGQNTLAAAQWRQANPESTKAIKLRRRARERDLPAQFTGEDWQRALDYFGGRCAVCGRPPGLWHTLAADHWIPVTAEHSPGTVPTNMVPLCHGVEGCNNSKSDNDPAEWLTRRVGSSKAHAILERIASYFEALEG